MAQEKISLKLRWLSNHFGQIGAAVLGALLLMTATELAAAKIIFAGTDWVAIDFGKRCEARSAALWARPGTTPYAGFAFDRGSTRQGQFYVHLSKPARAGATVIATIGAQPFLLAGTGEWAWSRNAAQQMSMIEAARAGGSMRVDSRDGRGSRIVDRYGLAAAPTAIDAAAAACAGKTG